MTELYGVNYTKHNSGTPVDIIARGVGGGIVQCIFDTYEAAATTAADTVLMGRPLNDGDVVIGFILSTDDMGSSNTLSIGDGDSATRYASAIDTNAAAVSGNTGVLVDGMGYVIGTATDDDKITLTLNTAAMTGTIKICVLYIAA